MKSTWPGLMLLAILCMGNLSTVFAQGKLYRYGKVDDKYVQMKTFEADPDAGAVVLFDHETREYETREDKYYVLVYSRHRRIKILSESEVHLANVSVPYYSYSDNEQVMEVAGVTYNEAEDGEIIKLKMNGREHVFDEDLMDGRYSVKKFTLPNVKVGSVIEYKYKILSRSVRAPRTWYFQAEYPTLHSEVSLGVPEGFDYGNPTILGEIMNLDRSESNLNSNYFDDGTLHTYIAKNVPALNWENIVYTPNRYNFLFRLDWELKRIAIPGRYYKEYTSDWKEIYEDIVANRIYKSSFEPSSAVKKEMERIPEISTNDPLEKAQHIFGYLRENINWNKQHSMFASQGHAQTLSKKEGNGASINLLVMSMLREAGLKAYPVLISTRSHGIVQRFFPAVTQFNHVVTALEIDSNYILLDGTNGNTGFGILPVKDLNGIGFLVSEKGYDWISLTPSKKRQSKTTVTAALDAEGDLTGKLKAKDQGYGAYFSRMDYFHEADKDQDTYFRERWMEGLTDTELEGYELKDEKNVNKPMTSSCTFTSSDFANVIGDKIFFSPMTFSAKSENPFKSEERRFPVDFICPIKEQYLMLLDIPEGYEVEEMPSSARMVLPDKSASFTFQSNQVGNKIQLLSTFEIKKPMYSIEEYPALRQMFDQVVARHSEKIVFKKM